MNRDEAINSLIEKLPPPEEAQKYRASVFYDGPFDDIVAKSIQECDVNGPIVAYVFR